ncbi:1,4-alpha-glucan branching enzyme [Pollutimonas bauzanensis]|uniref:1,4-alpha-glucan branching enzyme GlgB n=2 Tax=Pollutimonas bauzanensis TaxID=658167 RepID=A0A1M5SVW2_9BURK|nr:1,4-alpha-glucan branching protein GlgB [Pollutimonas bauzanensis]SHH42398.1 1,4-alpha-glucan branching enzyme [Pollutimonas bauzanensis]
MTEKAGVDPRAGEAAASGLLLGELDLHLIAEGRHWRLADCLGAHVMTVDGVPGARFAVWAPNARRVAVVGDFNSWDGRRDPMRLRRECGVWELFIPGVAPGARYKFELIARDGSLLPLKADPLARQTEMPPATASVVAEPAGFEWTDAEWMATRGSRQQPDAPISIYEAHFGSWMSGQSEGEGSTWAAAGRRLIEYVVAMGFTHLELLPITEHPFGGSWGYQPLGMFAPSARYGSPAEFAKFVDECHRAGLALILDWVPAHFPSDLHGLANFDGTSLYEHADPRQGLHPDWNTLIYNMGRNEVRNFLLCSALEWVERYHVDGLRVDAVASMLYLDYSREAGQWTPNRHGGRENLEAVDFLQQLNSVVPQHSPGAIMIAEESTAWPGVTAPQATGGLGFQYKWNMGWMHDTLHYMEYEPVHRRFHHHDMTFGMVYAYSERFILPLSHDEVVHGKHSLLGKMPGDSWQRFANLRAYYGFMWGHPGKKLLFMGGELAQEREWNHDAQLDWPALGDTRHAGVQKLLRDLNAVYRATPALHGSDADPQGFSWVIGDDQNNSVFAFLRRHGGQCALVVSNMTPVPRADYRIGVPVAGRWVELLNTDAQVYGGANMGNGGGAATTAQAAHGQEQSLRLMLPPLSTLILAPEGYPS